MAQSAREMYWSALIADFRRSGLTHVQFCRLRRVPIHSFRKWLYRLRPGLPAPSRAKATTSQASLPHRSAPPAFLPVHIRPEQPFATDARQRAISPAPLELVLAHDRRLRIPVGFDPATLRQLLAVLEQRP
jgi:hypothetical protein